MIIAVALWFFPVTIIGPTSSDSNDDITGPDWVLLSVTLVGLYVLIFVQSISHTTSHSELPNKEHSTRTSLAFTRRHPRPSLAG